MIPVWSRGYRVRIFLIILFTLQAGGAPLPYPDYHDLKHHDASNNDFCPLHNHLAQWHPEIAQSPDVREESENLTDRNPQHIPATDQDQDHAGSLHFHWVGLGISGWFGIATFTNHNTDSNNQGAAHPTSPILIPAPEPIGLPTSGVTSWPPVTTLRHLWEFPAPFSFLDAFFLRQSPQFSAAPAFADHCTSLSQYDKNSIHSWLQLWRC